MAFSIERNLHKKYGDKRLEGEWFTADYDEVVSDLCELLSKVLEGNMEGEEIDHDFSDIIDFATGETEKLNRYALLEIGASDYAISEIEKSVLSIQMQPSPKMSIFKEFFEIAYTQAGVKNARDLVTANYETKNLVFTLEQIMAAVITAEKRKGETREQIYKVCKERCESAKKIAMIA